MNIKFTKKISFICIVIVVFGLFSPLFAKRASAQWPVWDPLNFVPNASQQIKAYVLDGLAWTVTNRIIERLTASTVQWINSGFKGNPAFITNPEAYFKNMGDNLAGEFIFTQPALNFLCEPFQAKIRLALTESYAPDPNARWQCTLSDVVGNFDGLMQDFSKGGWEGFIELSQRPQNNPLGAYLQAEAEMSRSMAELIGFKQNEISQGSGFLSYKKCARYGVAMKRIVQEAGTTREVTDPAPCLEEETVTPGSVIEKQLNQSLGAGKNRLNVATQINQIVGALISELTEKALKGLRDLARPESTGQKSFQEQLNQASMGSRGSESSILGNDAETGWSSNIEKPEPIPDFSELNFSSKTNEELVKEWEGAETELNQANTTSTRQGASFKINQIRNEFIIRGVCGQDTNNLCSLSAVKAKLGLTQPASNTSDQQ